jgi:hypothetical protein
MQIGADHLRIGSEGPNGYAMTQVRLSQLLGSGRHGMVFMGAQRIADGERIVAVKIPSSPNGLDHEREALMLLQHRNIVSLLDVPLSNGALVLEHCDLGTLAAHLTEHALTLGELRWMFDAILPALEHIHTAGWIHGDISPGNIGMRTMEGPVLLDFATARPADGSPIDEGTAEFAGPLRYADPRLDIRCLAATAVAALGASERWDHSTKLVQDELSALIQRCDADQTAGVDDLAAVARNLLPKQPTGPAPRRLSGGGPGISTISTTTRAFGPRPARESVGSSEQSTHTPQLLLIVVLAIIGAAFSWELAVDQTPRTSNEAGRAKSATLLLERTAQQTLEQARATWNGDTGVITLATASDSVTHLAVGERGDLAAIGDWSCDGTETLGVYRPTTGNWFAFDSWEHDSTAVPTVLDRGNRLTVASDHHGCATPVVR